MTQDAEREGDVAKTALREGLERARKVARDYERLILTCSQPMERRSVAYARATSSRRAN